VLVPLLILGLLARRVIGAPSDLSIRG